MPLAARVRLNLVEELTWLPDCLARSENGRKGRDDGKGEERRGRKGGKRGKEGGRDPQ